MTLFNTEPRQAVENTELLLAQTFVDDELLEPGAQTPSGPDRLRRTTARKYGEVRTTSGLSFAGKEPNQSPKA